MPVPARPGARPRAVRARRVPAFPLCVLLALACGACAPDVAPAPSAADRAAARAACEAAYRPHEGQGGKDVVWLPTPDAVVDRMLALAHVGPADRVYDLGAGDGKIALAAARQFGARAVGVELHPGLAALGRCYAAAEGLAHRVRIVEGDLFDQDLGDATVVTLFLLPELNRRLRPRLLALRPGTRVVSHLFMMGDWLPDETAEHDHTTAHLWIVPAAVTGDWTFTGNDGPPLRATLGQTYQQVAGQVRVGDATAPVERGRLHGDALALAFRDPQRGWLALDGRVDGDRFTGVLRGPDGSGAAVTGRRR